MLVFLRNRLRLGAPELCECDVAIASCRTVEEFKILLFVYFQKFASLIKLWLLSKFKSSAILFHNKSVMFEEIEKATVCD